MKRLAAVWRERRILTDLQAQEADHNIDAAVDDYHHHMDRRIQQNPPPVDEPEANSDSGDAMSHQSFSEDAPSADSVESAESLFGDSEEENRDEDIDHQRQQLLDTLTQEMAAVDSEKQLMVHLVARSCRVSRRGSRRRRSSKRSFQYWRRTRTIRVTCCIARWSQ